MSCVSIAVKQMMQVKYRDCFSRAVLWNSQCKNLNTAVTVAQFACAQRLWKLGHKGFKKPNQKFRIQNYFAFFFLGIVILRFVSRAIWQVFDETRLSTLKNLHPWNFLKSRSIGSFTIMVSSFRKRLSLNSESERLLKSWQWGDSDFLYCSEMAAVGRACTALGVTVLLRTVYIPASFFFLCASFCPAQQCMKQQPRLEVTQL